MTRLLLPILALLLSMACSPTIGDSCALDFHCSINGERTCDTSPQGGFCTVYGCESLTCPDDAICVRWRPEPSRLSFTACMKRCNGDGDCRFDDGFQCFSAMELEEGTLAEVVDIDRPEASFCVATRRAGEEE